MKANHLLFPLLIWGMTAHAKSTTPAVTTSNNLNFIENKGQVRDQYGKSRNDIDFRIGTAGLNMFVGNGQLHYQWATQLTKNSPDEDHLVKTGMYRMDVTLIGANIHAQVTTENKQGYYERYYQPVLGEQGVTALAYQKITYKDVYPNIDWVLYVKNNIIEYDFVVRPGGKVSDIQLQYGGATALTVSNGALTATTPMGSLTEHAPVGHTDNGAAVKTHFELHGNKLGFAAESYNGTLVIDPTLSWSTYYGGSGTETMTAGCVTGDNSGNGYLFGSTQSTSGIATVGSYKDTLNVMADYIDVFLVKFNASGVRQWATYYGGEGEEDAGGTTCDAQGNVYISGTTTSTTGIASTGAYKTYLDSFYDQDAFLVKFDSTGSRLWGTYYGGEDEEEGYAVACDKSNNIFLVGSTASTTWIATTGAYQTAPAGSRDCFVAKFNSSGSLQWGTYYGGAALEDGSGVTCDSNKNVFITGSTKSTSGIATTGAHQTSYGGVKDAFLAKFDSSGNIQWGTYYGGNGIDQPFSVVSDETGNAYLTGFTGSDSAIVTTGSYQDTMDLAGDAFLAKFSSTGTIQWATYYGGSNAAQGNSVTYFPGYVYFAGLSSSTNHIASPGAFQDTIGGGQDAILIKFDTSGHRIWGTYFGGEATESGCGVFCNALSKVFLGGFTASYGLLTTVSCYQSSNGGGSSDGFLAMFDDCTLTQPDTLIGHDTVCRHGSYTYYVPVTAGATSYTWTLPAGWSGTSTTDTIHITAGIHSDTIKVAANYTCGTSAQLKKVITVSPLPTITPIGTSSICNDDSITLTSSTGTAYQWLQGGAVISGAHSNNYTVHTGNHYSVIVISASGCADTSIADTIIVHPTPVPVITASGMLLSTGTYTSYQWNRNGTAITGAVNPTYIMVIDSGEYTVTVVDSNGCTGTSVVYNPTEGVASVNANNIVSVYPNPTSGIIYITATQKVNVTITGIDGRQIATYKAPKEVDLSGLSDGIYLLRITDDKEGLISIQKMVKAKTR